MLWGRAAARCEFSGCNRPLSRSSVTQETVNVAQKAHIYAFSSEGPRGNKGIPKAKLNDLDNLLLVCHGCHRKIDNDMTGGRYTAALLRQWKAAHERRVAVVTGVDPERRSHVVHYTANIHNHSALLAADQTTYALFPDRYPAEAEAIELGTGNSAIRDRDAAFWQVEETNLRRHFAQSIAERVSVGTIKHVSLFALAPQPLLVLLGSLLTDIVEVDVFAHHREPKGWRWQKKAGELGFKITPPSTAGKTDALVLSISGTVLSDRVRAALPATASIWRLDITDPHNDCLKSKEQLQEFRRVMRRLLNQINARHGASKTLHVFPAMPAAMAVELGRVRSPKVDMNWQLYDQVKALDGFVPAITI